MSWRRGVWAVVLIVGGSMGVRAQTPAAPMEHVHHSSAPSTVLSITVDGKTTSMSVAELEAMPQKTITVKNGHSGAEETYTGVPLQELLAKLGVSYAGGEQRIYHSYLKASGTDGYWVLYSASEIEDAVHAGSVLVATKSGGEAIKGDGAFRLVATEDRKPARWVRNLAALELKKAE